jgi:DNA-binding NarL/FixJ family response regulator
LAAATSGVPQVVLIEGAPGIGKSALLGAFSHGLVGAHLLSAAGDEGETTLGYGVLQQLLQTSRGWSDPFAAGAALLQHLGGLPEGRTAVILIDDAHWSDQLSLRAVNFMVRRLRADAVLVVLASRLDDAHLLPVGLVRNAETAGNRIVLGGLTDDEIKDLSLAVGAGTLTDRAAARLRAHTAGNPLHLLALLRELPLAVLRAVDRPLPAPHSFALLVLGDLAAASPAARQVVSAAAVLGQRAHVRDVLAVGRVEPGLARQALEELDRLGMLRLPAGETQVHFSHPLVRAAVYDDLGPGTRCQLHERAAGVLAGLAALRHRVSGALGPDPALASDLELEGGNQVRAGHPSAAAEAWLAAARLSATPAEADRRLLTGVDLLLRAGDVAAALGHADQVNALQPTDRTLHLQARIAWLTGHADDAVRLGRQAWERLPDLEPAERDELAAMLALIEMLRDHGAQAAAWAAAALEGDLDRDQAPQTRAVLAQGLQTSGRGDLGLRVLADLPQDPGLVEPRRHAELTARGLLRVTAGDLSGGDADLVVAGSLAHGDLSPFRLTARAWLAEARFRAGDWTVAKVIAEEVVSLAADTEQQWLAGFVHAIAARVPSGRGEWETAHHHVDTATALAADLQEPAAGAYADDAAVFLASCRDDPAEVVQLADRLRRGPHSTPHEPGVFTWPVHLVSALVELGSLDEAEQELSKVEDLARRRRHPSRLAAVARLHGQLAAARRLHADARSAFAAALTLSGDRVDADERAIAYLAYGRFLRRRGQRRAAVQHALEARRQYRLLGAVPFIARCDDLLEACGARPPGEPPVIDVLTPRERAVAALVASGRTKRQAADELVVSVKTINYHLENVYAKLAVHSRVELASRLAETCA